MNNLDGDLKLEYIRQKVENNVSLNRQDIMILSFIPLMASSKSKSEITLESIDLARNIHNNKEKTNCLMLLYALFDKFGDDVFAIAIFRGNLQFSYLTDNCKVHINRLIASINRKRGIGHE